MTSALNDKKLIGGIGGMGLGIAGLVLSPITGGLSAVLTVAVPIILGTGLGASLEAYDGTNAKIHAYEQGAKEEYESGKKRMAEEIDNGANLISNAAANVAESIISKMPEYEEGIIQEYKRCCHERVNRVTNCILGTGIFVVGVGGAGYLNGIYQSNIDSAKTFAQNFDQANIESCKQRIFDICEKQSSICLSEKVGSCWKLFKECIHEFGIDKCETSLTVKNLKITEEVNPFINPSSFYYWAGVVTLIGTGMFVLNCCFRNGVVRDKRINEFKDEELSFEMKNRRGFKRLKFSPSNGLQVKKVREAKKNNAINVQHPTVEDT